MDMEFYEYGGDGFAGIVDLANWDWPLCIKL